MEEREFRLDDAAEDRLFAEDVWSSRFADLSGRCVGANDSSADWITSSSCELVVTLPIVRAVFIFSTFFVGIG